MKVFVIKADQFILPVLKLVASAVRQALPGGAVEIRVQRESKKRIQEEKYHAMINDIAESVELYGRKFPSKVWKAMLVDAFEEELRANGEALRHPGEVVVSLDQRRAVTIRPTTTEFLKKEASMFIEFLYMKGAEYEVQFSEKSLEYYEEAQRYLGRAA